MTGVVLALTAAYRVLLVMLVAPGQQVQWIPDDAFYYLMTARHVAAGDGLTFDGVNPASGFHPLWLLWCVAAGGDKREVMLGGILLSCGSAWLLWKLLRVLRFSRCGAALGICLFMLNPRLFTNSINGMETALVTFLWLLLVTLLIRWLDETRAHRLLVPGLVAGLLWLARTDMIFVLAAMLLYVAWRLPRSLRWRGVKYFVAGLAPLPLAWLAFHYAVFGTIFAGSADALPFVVRATDPLAVQGFMGHLQCGLGKLLQTAVRWEYITGWPFAALLTLLLVSGLLWQQRTRGLDLAAAWWCRLLALMWAASGLLLLTHAVVRLHPTHWYFETVAVLMLLTALTLARAAAARYRIAGSLVVTAGLAMLAAAAGWFMHADHCLKNGGDYPWQAQLFAGAVWAGANTPPDAVLGAFDAGILAYSSGRRVVNLDGVINDHAGRAVRERRLFAYMREQNITYYIDHDPFMRDLFTPFFGDSGGLQYEKLATFDAGTSLNNSPVSAFRLTWPPALH